jgi:hypothetical protein
MVENQEDLQIDLDSLLGMRERKESRKTQDILFSG